MDLRQRKVAEDEPQLGAQLLPDRRHDGVGAVTMRTLVVAVLDERHGRVPRANSVIILAHVGTQRSLFVRAHPAASELWACRFSSASRMPSAPGLTPTGEQ